MDNTDDSELWLPIFGMSGCGYEVSNLGRVRSWREWYPGAPVPRILSTHAQTRTRHLRVKLYLHDGRARTYLVHRLVARTFMCPTEGRDQINHINGEPTDNRLDNLEWCTALENQRHARETGLICQHGERGSRAACSDFQASVIRRMRDNGMSYDAIREVFPMAKSTLSYICNRRTYRSV